MIGINFSVKGLNSVNKAIQGLNARVVNAADLVVKEAGERVAKDAKGSAPVDSGRYRRSIRSKYEKARNLARIASWLKGRPSPLGHLLEFGHRDKTTGKFIPGKPHLLPAFDRERGQIVVRLRREIAK